MAATKAKGFLFHYAIDYVNRKWGRVGVAKLGLDKSKYVLEKWYPLEEFLELLESIDKEFNGGPVSNAQKMAYETMKRDPKWQAVFKGKDPRDLFLDTKYQNQEYEVGDFMTYKKGQDEIVTTMRVRSLEDKHVQKFSDFYLGKMLAVLDMTGAEGTVDRTLEDKGGKKTVVYNLSLK